MKILTAAWPLILGGLLIHVTQTAQSPITITPEDWGLSDAEWIDNQTIRVVKNLSGDDEARKEHVIIRFRRTWQWHSSNPSR